MSLTQAGLEEIKTVLAERERTGRTHWDRCYLDPSHRDCLAWILISEIEALRSLNEGLAERVAQQSELLSKKAERPAERAPTAKCPYPKTHHPSCECHGEGGDR